MCYFLGARREFVEDAGNVKNADNNEKIENDAKTEKLQIRGVEIGKLGVLRVWKADFASARAAVTGSAPAASKASDSPKSSKTPESAKVQLVVCTTSDCCYAHLDYHSFASAEVGRALADVFDVAKRVYPNFVPRINCVDSLDRTNAALGVFLGSRGAGNASNEENPLLDDLVTGGNAVSRQYASSDAMKQDQVRHGVRTLGGRLSDLRAWFLRLVRNNSSDAAASDGFRAV